MKRVTRLEQALAKVKHKRVEVYEYVDEGLEVLERTARRHEKKCEKREARMKDMEETLLLLKAHEKGKAREVDTASLRPSSASILPSSISQWLFPSFSSAMSPPTSPKRSIRSTASPSSPYIRLETIPEEGVGITKVIPASSSGTPTSNANLKPQSSLIPQLYFLMTMPLRIVLRFILPTSR